MYDMYPWDAHTAAADTGRAGSARTPARALAVHAVQVALDRRDNGGDAAAAPGAAGTPAEPTAGPTRQ